MFKISSKYLDVVLKACLSSERDGGVRIVEGNTLNKSVIYMEFFQGLSGLYEGLDGV